MGSEKYKLKWSKYESNILSAFHGLLESENLSDVTLFCEGQSFKAHRLVLAACSTHFETLFSHTPASAPLHNQFFVILDGTRADDLQILLHFMYRGEAYLHQDRINSVLRTAEVLQVKGLSEGPRNIEINQNLTGGNGGRSWSPVLTSNPELASSSPRQQQHKKLDPSSSSPMLRRPSSPPPPTHGNAAGGMSPGYSPYAASASREPFPMYSGRGMGSYSRGGGADSDTRPSSNKTDPRHTPSEYDRSSLPSPHKNNNSFPSDSTTDHQMLPGPSSGLLRTAASLYDKQEDQQQRHRRSSDSAGMEVEEQQPQHPRSKFGEFRNSREEMALIASRSPISRNTDLRMSDEDVRNQVAATNLETFRRLAQAHAEREREQLQLPRGGGGIVRGLPTVSLAPGLTASDYMRFAMPVRDPDHNGDPAISGSGTKLRCPFCERTYGYETNLRAHIRQRHQGIRVSCPYCPRTFTRNNTVRRHVQREHRHLTGRIPTKFGSTRVMPDPISAATAAALQGRALVSPPASPPPMSAGGGKIGGGGGHHP